MTVVDMVQTKRKRVSKKRKSAWRKHSQVKEVDEYFKNKRIEDRLGAFANEKDVENLFTTDEDGLKDTAPKKIKRSKDDVMKSHFPPSLDHLIKPIKHLVPNKTRVRDTRISLPVKIPVHEEEEDNAEEPETKKFFDIWGAPKTTSQPSDDYNEHGRRVCKMIRVKPPAHFGKKPSDVPAIPIPLPGISYNPSPEDHKDLIMKAFGVEEEKLKKETKILNATVKMFPTKAEAPTEESWLKEMSEGLPGQENEEEEEDDDGEERVLNVSHNRPVRREDKKTEKERRKLKERKTEEKKLQMEKELKVKEGEKFKINTAKKRLRQEEMRLAIRQSWRRYDALLNKDLPKKLGRARFKEPDLVLKLSSEMTDSLRTLKPEGHILKEFESSIQRRSMAPAKGKPETKKRVKRFKPKVFEKPDHKAITI